MTRGSFFDEDVPFGIIFPSIGLGRPGPTATTTPALSCDIERRREREREREREKGESLAHGTLWNFSKERERERDENKRRCIDAKHSPLSSFETIFIFPSLAREDINSTDDDDDDDWKILEEKKKKKKKKKKNRALYSRRFLAAKSHRSFSSPRRRVPPTLCPSKGRAFSPRLGS